MSTPLPGSLRNTEHARLTLAQLPSDASLNHAFRLACEAAARALGVERVSVWLFVDDRSALRCATLYELSKDEHSSGSILRVADFPNYFSSLNIRKAVPAELASVDPRTAELSEAYLNPLNISSMLDAGIFVDGELVGVVCHEQVGNPCEWTTEARDFAGSVADLLALRIKGAEANELRMAFRKQSQRLAALQITEAIKQVTAGVIHDFNNILMIVSANAELIEMDPTVPVPVQERARIVTSAVEGGQAILNQLREFSRDTPRPPSVLDLSNATGYFLPVLSSSLGYKHRIEFTPNPQLGRVLLDQTQYSRILLNLVMNARDALPQGGVIRIRLAPVRLTMGNEMLGHFILLEVCDDGIGMDTKTRKQAMEPFFTTKSTGTGLGLAVVRHIVDQVGGVIRIDSNPGAGTRVSIFFPRVGASSGGTIEYTVPPEIQSHGEIL